MKTELLLFRINSKKARIAVIGTGYVGLPLAVLLAKKGYSVIGFTKSKKSAFQLLRGKSEVPHVERDLKKVLKSGRFKAQAVSERHVKGFDVYIVCVPTPVDKNKKTDVSNITSVVSILSKIDIDGKLVINESTVAPFTTRKLFSVLRNCFLACSPERVDPGNKTKTIKNIPKIISGRDQESLKLIKAFYGNIFNKTISCSSMETAEMSKMLENTYRSTNIALVNEFAKLADKLKIDVKEVINAASTKWSFDPHYPGLGVGGHCIPVDPYYLLDLSSKVGVHMPLVRRALYENEQMPEYTVNKILKNYKKGLRVLVYGLSYKKDISDLRESPVITLCSILKSRGVEFTIYDPFVNSGDIQNLGFSVGRLAKTDIFIVGTDHTRLKNDYKLAVGRQTLVIDGRNFFTKKIGKKVIGIGRLLE